jgi:hypothetical protein
LTYAFGGFCIFGIADSPDADADVEATEEEGAPFVEFGAELADCVVIGDASNMSILKFAWLALACCCSFFVLPYWGCTEGTSLIRETLANTDPL